MAFQLPRLLRANPLVDGKGLPTVSFQTWWQSVVKSIEDTILSIQDAVAAIQAAQAAADLANAAAVTAQAAAVTAQAAADTAQTTAEAAQAAVDAIELPPSGVRTVTANTNVAFDDGTILVDATAGAVTVTLRFAAVGDTVLIKKIDASANVVTVAAQGGETINGAANIPLAVQYAAADCLTDGFEWYT